MRGTSNSRSELGFGRQPTETRLVARFAAQRRVRRTHRSDRIALLEHLHRREHWHELITDVRWVIPLMHDLQQHDTVVAAQKDLATSIDERSLGGNDATLDHILATLGVERGERHRLSNDLAAVLLQFLLIAPHYVAPQIEGRLDSLVDRHHYLRRRDVLDEALPRHDARAPYHPIVGTREAHDP